MNLHQNTNSFLISEIELSQLFCRPLFCGFTEIQQLQKIFEWVKILLRFQISVNINCNQEVHFCDNCMFPHILSQGNWFARWGGLALRKPCLLHSCLGWDKANSTTTAQPHPWGEWPVVCKRYSLIPIWREILVTGTQNTHLNSFFLVWNFFLHAAIFGFQSNSSHLCLQSFGSPFPGRPQQWRWVTDEWRGWGHIIRLAPPIQSEVHQELFCHKSY